MSDNSAFEILRHTIDIAAARFAKSLELFRAWHGAEGITEANITLQVAAAFISIHPDAIVFVEVPFAPTEKARTNNRLDLYLATPDIAFLVEAKCLWSPEQVRAIGNDIARLGGPLLASISEQHRGALPRRCHGVVIADTWHPEDVRWWHQKESKRTWPREGYPGTWQYGSQQVFKASENLEGTLHWLFGMGPDLREEQTTA
jgi:hypothetical protein